MAQSRYILAAVATNGYIYALGGRVADPVNIIERASVNSDGSLGPWQTVEPMGQPRDGLAAVATNNYIYALGDGIIAVAT